MHKEVDALMREISEVLRLLAKIRKECGRNIEEVQQELAEKYQIKAAVKTIYGWESGKVQPPIKSFVALCKIYQISDMYELFADDDDIIEDTIREQRLIRSYNKNVKYQAAVNKLLSL